MDLSESHVIVLLLMLALEVLALVQVWRDRRRTLVVKVLWTLVILALPVIGVLGWAVNWLLGKAAEALQRRNA
ncbi:PLDc N-terminal domain-containing protein [Curtobacterium sp. VKM Ac-2861]|uniref:PLDc N-terminal domain-containing protein n=1 Tax=unclassified Curtobacterium TaxID=257496 RepID=UPI000F48FBDC|nr:MULTISPECIES: PLDc N-terminal domain-containing protein [unclassified Curtobacterium]MBF4587740.1 PLDc N-terminal domain-containing protein [Curtobacterium sp. VKM Ac-2887]NQW92339.1 PLDc N-terminal domain-containing protein [Curtobacterium sp. VKM Ac-2861]